MRLFEVFEQTEPSDEDLFGPSEPEKIRQAVLDELDNILMNYHEWPSLHVHKSVDKTKAEYASLQKVRDTFERGGLIKGFRSLDLLSQNLIDHLDNELSFNHNIILGQAEAKYLQGQSKAQPFQDTYIRENETDDELFGNKQEIKSNLSKVNTKTLLQMLHLSTIDTRPQYADAHALQASRIKRELRSRGVQINENDSDEDIFGPERITADNIKRLFDNGTKFNYYSNSDNTKRKVISILPEPNRPNIYMIYVTGNEFYAARNTPFTLTPSGTNEYTIQRASLNENEPSDDELFGDDISPQWKIVNLIDEQIQFNQSQIRLMSLPAYGGLKDKDVALIDQRQKNIKRLEDYKRAFSRSLRDGIALWSSDMAETDAFKNPYRSITLWVASDARANNIDLYDIAKGHDTSISENTEPSDDELFGDQTSLIRNRVIEAIEELQDYRRNKFYEILNATNVSSISDIDADDEANWDVLDELEELNQHADIYARFIREFNTGLKQGLEYYAKSMSYELGGAHYEVAEFIGYHVLEKFGTNLKDLTKQVLGVDIE